MPDRSATDHADHLDAELRRIAEALVAHPPEHPDLFGAGAGDAPYVMPRRVPRRRVLLRAAAVVAALLGAARLIAVAQGDPSDDVDLASPEPTPGLAAPQRLLLNDWWGALGADGEPTKLELAGLDPHGPPQPFVDGGHVVVGIHPVDEPVPEGFDEHTDLTYGLAVVDSAGEVVVEREIEPSTLLGVTATEAILARGEAGRPDRIVAQDLRTGDERVVREGPTSAPHDMVTGDSAVVGDDLVTVEVATSPGASGPVGAPSADDCTLRTVDLTTGASSERELDLACATVIDVQPAPDGARLALIYESPSDDFEVRLADLDLVDGTVTHDQLLGHDIVCADGDSCPDLQPAIDPLGMAWNDGSTLRVALRDLAATPDWNFDEDDLTADQLHIETVDLP